MTYNIGTVSVSSGSTTVTGSGTSWVAIGVREGDFLIANGLVGIIASVQSNTALTLLRGWPGSTASGQNYSIALIDDGQRSIASLNAVLQALEGGVASGRFGDGNAAQPGIAFVDQINTGFFRKSASVLALSVNGTERAQFNVNGMEVTGRLTATGDAAIGTQTLENGAALTIVSGGTRGLKITRNQSSPSNSTYALEVDNTAQTANVTSAGAMAVDVASGKAFVVDGLGRVGVGTAALTNRLTVADGTSGLAAAFIQNTDGANGSGMLVRGGGTNAGRYSALFQNAAGSELMRIQSNGNVGIGTSSPDGKLTVGDTSTSGDVSIRIKSNATSRNFLMFGDSDSPQSGDIMYDHASNYMRFRVADVERMRILLTGTVLFGTSSSFGEGGVTLNPANSNGAAQVVFNRAATTSTSTVLVFQNGGSAVGNINHTNTATSYNTSSDHRLKENVQALTGAADRLLAIPVKRFNFIADPARTVDGFLAHEVQDHVPEAVTGEKDAVDADGNPEYQSIDHSKLVPLLTAALQEALGEIADLRARLDAANL